MPRRSRTVLLVPLAAAALAVAGCSTAVAGTPYPLGAGPALGAVAAPAPTGDTAAWVDRVCGTVLPALRASANSPHVDYTDVDKATDTLEQHLRDVSAAAGRGLAELDRVGPSPTRHGDELVAQFRTGLLALQRLDPDAPAGAASPPAPPLAPVNPAALLAEDPELAGALAHAENCTALSTPPAPVR
jgi:hypothetical protein